MQIFYVQSKVDEYQLTLPHNINTKSNNGIKLEEKKADKQKESKNQTECQVSHTRDTRDTSGHGWVDHDRSVGKSTKC